MHDAGAPLELPANHGILLFDGVCNFCNGAVNFIIDHDPQAYFRFAALQSDAGQALLARFNLPRSDFDTMIVIDHGQCYQRSTAALQIARHLTLPWRLGAIGLLIPAFVRDPLYALVARNRYRWFGRQDACRIPTPDIRARFL